MKDNLIKSLRLTVVFMLLLLAIAALTEWSSQVQSEDSDAAQSVQLQAYMYGNDSRQAWKFEVFETGRRKRVVRTIDGRDYPSDSVAKGLARSEAQYRWKFGRLTVNIPSKNDPVFEVVCIALKYDSNRLLKDRRRIYLHCTNRSKVDSIALPAGVSGEFELYAQRRLASLKAYMSLVAWDHSLKSASILDQGQELFDESLYGKVKIPVVDVYISKPYAMLAIWLMYTIELWFLAYCLVNVAEVYRHSESSETWILSRHSFAKTDSALWLSFFVQAVSALCLILLLFSHAVLTYQSLYSRFVGASHFEDLRRLIMLTSLACFVPMISGTRSVWRIWDRNVVSTFGQRPSLVRKLRCQKKRGLPVREYFEGTYRRCAACWMALYLYVCFTIALQSFSFGAILVAVAAGVAFGFATTRYRSYLRSRNSRPLVVPTHRTQQDLGDSDKS